MFLYSCSNLIGVDKYSTNKALETTASYIQTKPKQKGTKMKNNAEIEKLQRACSTLNQGLNAVSIDLDTYLMFEDMIFNNHYDLAIETLKDKGLKISNEDRIALLFVFSNALAAYNQLIR